MDKENDQPKKSSQNAPAENRDQVLTKQQKEADKLIKLMLANHKPG